MILTLDLLYLVHLSAWYFVGRTVPRSSKIATSFKAYFMSRWRVMHNLSNKCHFVLPGHHRQIIKSSNHHARYGARLNVLKL